MELPERLNLAHLPTPIQRMERLSGLLGRRIDVKRDDLTGSHLSGNKVRKLELLLADAKERRATHVVTCGGVQSNHCRATALAAAPLGLQPVLLLRTPKGRDADFPSPASGNVLLDRLAGAILRACTPEEYGSRDAIMASIAARIEERGGRPYIIPEGGSNALGALGYVRAAREIAEQMSGDLPDSVVVATGSGGTVAGLALGFKELGVRVRTFGVAVCDDEARFRAVVHAISADAARDYGLTALGDEDFQIVDGYQGRGYALSGPHELALLRDTARRDGLVLDPVYTVKAFGGMLDMLRRDGARLGDHVLFIHTGGIFGLMAAAQDLETSL